MYAILLILAFAVLAWSSIRQRKLRSAALVLFFVALTTRLAMLFLWAYWKNGSFNANFLQFVDEEFYVGYSWGDARAAWGNAYCVIVCGLRQIGFTIVDLKVLNICVSSFILVRLLSLHDCVSCPVRYYRLLLVVGAVLNLHEIFYSLFVLKDTITYYVAVELFLQLVRRRQRRRSWPIMLNILALTQMRSTLVLMVFVFLWDHDWKISRVKAWTGTIITLMFASALWGEVVSEFGRRVSMGEYFRLGLPAEDRYVPAHEAAEYLLTYGPTVISQNFAWNARKVLVPFAQNDLINVCIILCNYSLWFYLICVEGLRTRIRTMWPILVFPLIFLCINLPCLFNLRWAIYPFSTFLTSLIFLASKPSPSVLPKGGVCVPSSPHYSNAGLRDVHGSRRPSRPQTSDADRKCACASGR